MFKMESHERSWAIHLIDLDRIFVYSSFSFLNILSEHHNKECNSSLPKSASGHGTTIPQCRASGIKTCCCYGGASKGPQAIALRDGVHGVIGYLAYPGNANWFVTAGAPDKLIYRRHLWNWSIERRIGQFLEVSCFKQIPLLIGLFHAQLMSPADRWWRIHPPTTVTLSWL